MTPYVMRVIGGNMLNFGYWDRKTANLVEAQLELCKIVGKFAEMDYAKSVLDVGSGFSEPAKYWKSVYNTDIACLDINLLQLKTAASLVRLCQDRCNALVSKTDQAMSFLDHNVATDISLLNGTAKILPFRDECMDRVIALESAQHFKPLVQFIEESKRILIHDDGLFVVAIPVTITMTRTPLSKIRDLMRLGILSLTWTSQHYELESVKSLLNISGFKILDIQYIGSHVYEPLATYYIQNRKKIKNIILKERTTTTYQNLLYEVIEKVVYNSALKMKEAFQRGFIDYVLIKARRRNY